MYVVLVSGPVRWHGIALSTSLKRIAMPSGISLCRNSVTTELVSLQDEGSARARGYAQFDES